MIETLEMIQLCLDNFGEELVFVEGIILAIPGVSVYAIQNYNSPFDIEKQVYTFTTSITYFQSIIIEEGLEFTLTLGTRVHTFTTVNWNETEPNWIRFRVNLVSSVG